MKVSLNFKKIIKWLCGYNFIQPYLFPARRLQYRIHRKGRFLGLLKAILLLPQMRIVHCSQAGKEFFQLCQKVSLKNEYSKYFYYSVDPYVCLYRKNDQIPIRNITIGYDRFLYGSILELENSIQTQIRKSGKTPFLQNSLSVIQGLRSLTSRIKLFLQKDSDVLRRRLLLHAFETMETLSATTFHEALQRILFLNQILWQCGNELNGLGRLDQILLPYYLADKKNGNMDATKVVDMLRDFLTLLHRDVNLKSDVLIGDTGQIIILGGVLSDGSDACNELTEYFLQALGSLHLPDPKILFRVNKKTPRRYIELATNCLKEQIGSPLFSNDEVIIPALINFGYSLHDARNYSTAACWEPLVAGCSMDQGNVESLNFLVPFLAALKQTDNLISRLDFQQFLECYENNLCTYIEELVIKANRIQWQRSPFISLFVDDCLSNSMDISEGGARYNHYGFTTVGMGNLVDSLLNIQKLVVEQKNIDFKKIKNAVGANFKDSEQLLQCLHDQPFRYGCDEVEVVEMVNRFTLCVEKKLSGCKNRLGGMFKFGLSSPSYIMESVNFPATPDGRKNGDPFCVHISQTSLSTGYTDLVRFAAHLEYQKHRFNGNVVDFIVDPNFINSAGAKFSDFIEGSIRSGFFQMQMTIVNSTILRAAIENPEKFPNLIVRVWGFSAYFKDLPWEYKQVVLERTLRSEAASR
jgi:pyruvate-formate lyase